MSESMQVDRPRAFEVIGFTLFASVLVGFLTAAFIVAAGELDDGSTWSSLATSEGLGELATIAAIASAPYSVPCGLLGGAVALRRLRRARNPAPRANWIGRGAIWGAIVGALWSVLWIQIIALAGGGGGEGIRIASLFFAIVGAFAGALSGSLVGAYCSRVERRGRHATPAHA